MPTSETASKNITTNIVDIAKIIVGFFCFVSINFSAIIKRYASITFGMELLKIIYFTGFKFNQRKNKVIYKIIDGGMGVDYSLQCVNYKTVFEANILEIIFDTDILHGLHPLQSCFIGIEYAFYIKTANKIQKNSGRSIDILNNHQITSSSKLKLNYINRKGFICYTDTTSNEMEIVDPKDIVFVDSIIKEFHPGESFYIGFCAGKKISIENNIFFLHKAGYNVSTNKEHKL